MSAAVTLAARALALRETLPADLDELSLTDQLNVEEYARERSISTAAAWRRIHEARRNYARATGQHRKDSRV